MHISDAELKLLEIVVPHLDHLSSTTRDAISTHIHNLFIPPTPADASAAPAAPATPVQVIKPRVKESAPRTLDELIATAVDGSPDQEDDDISKLRRRIIYHLGEDFLPAAQGTFSPKDRFIRAAYKFTYQNQIFTISIDAQNDLMLTCGTTMLSWWAHGESDVKAEFLRSLHRYIARPTEAA